MKNCKICILTPPLAPAGLKPLSNLITIISQISDLLLIFTGDSGLNLKENYVGSEDVEFVEITHYNSSNIFSMVVYHLLKQIDISIKMFYFRNRFNCCIFFLESYYMLLPVITAKLLRKPTVFILSASLRNTGSAQQIPLIRLLLFAEKISFKISDMIVIYSKGLLKKWKLKKYEDKIFVASEHFFNNSPIIKDFYNRTYSAGFIGRLSEEKGIMNFLESLKILIETQNLEMKFLVGGDGPLKQKVEDFIKDNNYSDKIDFLGWIQQEKIPSLLTKINLLVIPSYSEGLPNIMLESMACGTPVLTNSVGSIPDYIIHQFNGFILEDNSPNTLAKSIIKFNNYPNLDEIAFNAQKTIENDFNLEQKIKIHKKMLKKVCKG